MSYYKLTDVELEKFIALLDAHSNEKLKSIIENFISETFNPENEIVLFKTNPVMCLNIDKVLLYFDKNIQTSCHFLWHITFLTKIKIYDIPFFVVNILTKKNGRYISITPMKDVINVYNKKTGRPKIIGRIYEISEETFNNLFFQIQNSLPLNK